MELGNKTEYCMLEEGWHGLSLTANTNITPLSITFSPALVVHTFALIENSFGSSWCKAVGACSKICRASRE